MAKANRAAVLLLPHADPPAQCLACCHRDGFTKMDRNPGNNTRRLIGPVGNIPPAETETSFRAAPQTEAMAGQPAEISLGRPGVVHAKVYGQVCMLQKVFQPVVPCICALA